VARKTITDFLQVNSFWLMDVAPVESAALPILTPLFGFSSITAPEITLEVFDITEGNSTFRKHVVKKADVGAITLQRGTTFYDSDFYRWTMAAARGSTSFADLGISSLISGIGSLGGATPRRDLVLIQYFRRHPFGVPSEDGSQSTAAAATAVAATSGLLSGVGAARNSAVAVGAATAQAAVGASAVGPFSVFAKLPARAWVLQGCLPTRYKAGSDFDASSGEISISELDLAVEGLEEVSLASV
jgi:T4-like virus tail tube protein gp19